MLHLFRDIAGFCALFHPILGAFPLDQIVDVGVNLSTYCILFGREIIFSVLTTCDHGLFTVPERYRQTDSRTTYCGITALCIASRVKNTAMTQ